MVIEHPRWNLRRFGQTFRHGTHSARNTVRQEAMEQMRRARRVPLWLQISHRLYRDYGLKHLCLISILIAYQFLGALIFYLCEHHHEETMEKEWNAGLTLNRTVLIHKIVTSMFNNTDYLFFLTQEQTNEVNRKLEFEMKNYEDLLGVKFKERTMKWSFWSAMLYAQMICTTIGSGFVRLHPSTTEGRICTMVYAIVGIPLVLAVLDDLGKLLTKMLKYPWYWIKCACRRVFRYCTKQSRTEIKKLDAEDRRGLELFELPISVAVLVVISWILICSTTFCIWETEWSYFISFYFFFISLSTIGIGDDFAPNQPKYSLILFIYIIVGLSLVSMLVNAIQARFERTRGQLFPSTTIDSSLYDKSGDIEAIRRRGSSLGIIRSLRCSTYSINREAVQNYFAQKRRHNKSSQTLLSFPSPTRNSMVTRSIYQNRIFPRTMSIDDVMKLVDTEEGDILLLTELTRDESQLSELSEAIRSDISRDSSVNQLVISKSFDSNFNPPQQIDSSYLSSYFSTSKPLPRQLQSQRLSGCPSTVPIPLSFDLETIEEIEDLLLLSRSGCYNADPTVHFRSRLSLVNEEGCTAERGESSISTSTTDQTLSSTTREREDSQPDLDQNSNRNYVRRNRAERTTRNNNQSNSTTMESAVSGSTNNNNNYQ